MRYRGHRMAAGLCVAMALCLNACQNSTSNGLMQDASPETSALALYSYDGEAVSRVFVFDTEQTQDILDRLDAVPAAQAADWSLDDITLPVYGLEIGATDGWSIFAAWSNGYWITQDGLAYRFAFDFAELARDAVWSDADGFDSFSVFPCARILSQDMSGWSSALLTPAPEPTPPNGISMTLEQWEDDTVTVRFTNKSGAEWSYGEHYTLLAQVEGAWCEIPAVPGNWAFVDIGYILPDSESQEKSYSLGMYGDLPPGSYRLVAENLWVEGTVVG